MGNTPLGIILDAVLIHGKTSSDEIVPILVDSLGQVVTSSDTNYKGWYATEAALKVAYPTADDGDYAIVGTTDTVWVWDTDTTAWVDSGLGSLVTSVNTKVGAVVLDTGDLAENGNLFFTNARAKAAVKETGQPIIIDGGTFAITTGDKSGAYLLKEDYTIKGLKLLGDQVGVFTVKIKYNADFTAAPADITGGGIGITGGNSSCDLNAASFSTTAIARFGIIKIEVTDNTGAHTEVSGLLVLERR